MNELVFKNESNQPVTNSLLVAQKFEKQHYHVIESIRDLLSTPEKSGLLNMFVESTYVASNGKENPMFIMNRDGFSLLVMGFTGQKALNFKIEFINAFNKMESQLNGEFKLPTTLSEALRLAADQAERIEEQQKLLEVQKPKVLFADAVSTSQRSCLIAELAKILQQNGIDMGQNRLFKWLRSNGYLCKSGEYYNQPSQKSMVMGLFELKKTTINKPDGTILVSVTTKVTGKGQIYFVNKFLNNK